MKDLVDFIIMDTTLAINFVTAFFSLQLAALNLFDNYRQKFPVQVIVKVSGYMCIW